MRFAKGHGTGNDFLILPDPDDALVLSPDLVEKICDRRTGLGADGILRVVRVPPDARDRADGQHREDSRAAGQERDGGQAVAEWFMDYRNADGSIAEMCGNGIRVFARYLLDHGLSEGPDLVVATRAGFRRLREEPGGQITVDMGAPAVLGRSAAVIAGRRYEGLEVSVGNPHLACVINAPVATVDLSQPPGTDPARFPDGANVEVLRVVGSARLEMRVHERGSGTTQSCGTGAVAAAVAAQIAASVTTGHADVRTGSAGPGTGTWMVQVPGGELTVTLSETTSLLTGPAVIVAEGELADAWLQDRGRRRLVSG
jgi:diaminopimelate epimerase